MTAAEPSRLEGRRVRRILLAVLVIPPVASVVATAIGALDAQASIVVMVTAILTLLAILVDVTLQDLADQHREVRAYKNDDEAIPYLCRYVEEEHPKTVDLLEYSGFGAMALLAKLGEVSSTRTIRLLVANPAAAISDYQRDFRLAESLRALAYRVPAEQAHKIGLQVKCYSEPASIRGRLLDRTSLVIGWYSYDDRGLADPGGRPISGASNTLVGADADHIVGQRLIEIYTRVFENLWRDACQPDEAWEPYRTQLPQLPKAEWLKAVRAND
jgi:hypothetical protein